jgi:hypothetical protein
MGTPLVVPGFVDGDMVMMVGEMWEVVIHGGSHPRQRQRYGGISARFLVVSDFVYDGVVMLGERW